MNRFFRNMALAGLLAIGLVASAYAQVVGTPVTQTASRLDAASFFVGQANGATSCNTVSQTAANDTITITPPSGLSVYLTGLYIQNSFDATGVTQTETVSFTNLSFGGGLAPFVNVGSALSTTTPTQVFQYIWPNGLKSAAPGTAVTIVPSATQSAHNYLCMQATGYFAP